MHTDPSQNGSSPEHAQHPEVSFEKRDLGARAILLFFVILFISGVAIHLVVWGLYEAFVNVGQAHQPPANPLRPQPAAPVSTGLQNGGLQNAGTVNLKLFPEPRLQTDEANDMNRFLWQEGKLLDAKPWRDESGSVHIPIAEAMQIVTQRGLPARPQGEQPSGQQPPSGQTSSGNVELSESERATDAVSVPGAPLGYDTSLSDREKEAPIPGAEPEKPHAVIGSAPGIPLYVPQPGAKQ